MGSVSGNAKKHDDKTLSLFDDPPEEDGVVNFNITFKGSIGDGYPVWTENKAKLIQRYVRYFLMITKHGTYIDGFAGPQVEEYNDDTWSAKRVLEIRPAWLRRFILCDKKPSQIKHLEALRQERQDGGDNRLIDIYPGDFNQSIDKILTPGAIRAKEATFCLLDQRTFECKWATVRKIAQYKPAKIEQFYFLPVGWLARSIDALKNDQILRDWWGRDDIDILRATSNSHAFALLFKDRFEKELGYKSVLAWPIFDRGEDGKIMYFMIHATDHPEAPRLMHRAYRQATLAFEPMEHLQAEFDAAGFEFSDTPE